MVTTIRTVIVLFVWKELKQWLCHFLITPKYQLVAEAYLQLTGARLEGEQQICGMICKGSFHLDAARLTALVNLIFRNVVGSKYVFSGNKKGRCLATFFVLVAGAGLTRSARAARLTALVNLIFRVAGSKAVCCRQ